MKDYDKELIEDICLILAADIITSGLARVLQAAIKYHLNEHNISYEEYCELRDEIIKRADEDKYI